VEDWDVRKVTSMQGMFQGTTVADPNVTFWDVRSLENAMELFLDAQIAKPCVTTWNTTLLRYLNRTFQN
ncbi:unnamed protein product, partial [Amoebophrya sp. A120]